MKGRVYKDTSPEAEKRRAANREACRRHYRRKKLGLPTLRVKTDLSHLTEDERQEYRRKAKQQDNARRMAQVNGLAKDGIISPSHIQHDEPLSRYLADKMVRQEAGISTRPGFNIIGDGCFRARRYQHHS